MTKQTRNFVTRIGNSTRFALSCRAIFALGVLLSGIGLRDAMAVPKDTIPGTFYAYDYKLDKISDTPGNLFGRGQASIVDYQGKYEIYNWGDDEYPFHAIRFKPDKIGDYITLRIHIVQTTEEPDYLYELESGMPLFYNEGR